MFQLKGITKNELYNLCLLRGISYATINAIDSTVNYESSWDKINYSMNDSQGSRGTITFKDNMVFGAFRNDNLEYIHNLDEALADIPKELKEIAKAESLQYLLLNNENGEIVPTITTLFWATDDIIYILQDNDEFHKNSGKFLVDMVEGLDAYLSELTRYFELNESQLDFINIVYHRKISKAREKVWITKEEMLMIGFEDGVSFEECIISFNEMDIYVQV